MLNYRSLGRFAGVPPGRSRPGTAKNGPTASVVELANSLNLIVFYVCMSDRSDMAATCPRRVMTPAATQASRWRVQGVHHRARMLRHSAWVRARHCKAIVSCSVGAQSTRTEKFKSTTDFRELRQHGCVLSRNEQHGVRFVALWLTLDCFFGQIATGKFRVLLNR